MSEAKGREDEGSRGRGTDASPPRLSRRGLFGLVAGAAAAIASVGRRRVDERDRPRRPGFWIGHS